MLAGKLSKKISILNPVATQSTVSGTQTITWSTFLSNAWAWVEPVKMRDIMKSGVNGQQLVNRITIRRTTGIDVNMRVVYNGSTYLIQDVAELDDRVEMTTMRLST